VIEVGNGEYIYADSFTGRVSKVEEDTIHLLNEAREDSRLQNLEFLPASFKELILHNVSSDTLGFHVDELGRLNQWKSTQRIIEESHAKTLGAEGLGSVIRSSFLDYLLWLRDLWITVCCAVFSIEFTIRLLGFSTLGLILGMLRFIAWGLRVVLWVVPSNLWKFVRFVWSQTSKRNSEIVLRQREGQPPPTPGIIRRPMSIAQNLEHVRLESAELNSV
jgi:hypothetical protein